MTIDHSGVLNIFTFGGLAALVVSQINQTEFLMHNAGVLGSIAGNAVHSLGALGALKKRKIEHIKMENWDFKCFGNLQYRHDS